MQSFLDLHPVIAGMLAAVIVVPLAIMSLFHFVRDAVRKRRGRKGEGE